MRNYYKKLFAAIAIAAQILLVGVFGTLAVANAQEVSNVTPDTVVTTDTTTTPSDTAVTVTAPVETPVLSTDKADYHTTPGKP